MENEPEISFNDPDTGLPEVKEESVPRRSWSRTKSKAGQWNASFVYDGATIYIKALSKDDRDTLKEKEKEMTARVAAFKEQFDATSDATERERLSDEMASEQTNFGQSIIDEYVVGWSGGEVPFSDEARSDLPLEMVMDWVPLILQKSVLGRTESELLKNSAAAS